MPDGIHGLAIDKIFKPAVPVGADDQHIRLPLFYDPGDLPAAVPEAETGVAADPLLLKCGPVKIQSFLIPPGFIVIRFLTQHQG